MKMQKSYAEQLDLLSTVLPSQIGLWTAESKDQIYTPETIFSYIDGAGEIYRAYNMRSCLSRRYTSPDTPAITLDIFDMGTSEDAFGVFTHDRDGRAVGVGQGALYRPGWLSFWKGRFFVSIYTEEETKAAKEAISELSRVVALLIKDQGPKPGILLKLPPKGLQSRSIRYLHHHTLLNYHFYLADENILNLGQQTDAVLAVYQRSGKGAHLLLVSYPNVEMAAEAHKGLLNHYLPEAKSTAAVLLEDGKWSATGLKNKFLVVVLEADTRPLAENLLR
ncbi:MAG: hypothetical protein OES18_22025, partial [Deltaproteobacteria bacterium]|nr:hypothetical protein [Deltaproteobacteria bacterium]